MRGRKPSLALIEAAPGPQRRTRMPKTTARIWDALAPHVPNLQEGHAPIFEDFCWCLAMLESERATLQAEGTLIRGKRGLVKNPRMQSVRELRRAVQRYSGDFGLNPVARLRLGCGVPHDDGDDSLLDGEWEPDIVY